jgi:hypothetical protein
MILTPLSNAFLFGNIIQQPKVFTQSFAKSIEVEGRKFNLKGFGKLTEYANGTKLVELSVTIENISEILQKIKINLTKILQPTEFSTSSVYSQSSPVQSYYTGPLQEYTWDGLYFVLGPGNSTIWVKYDHNNNYWRYYPLEWNRMWDMEGYEKLHTHMAASDVYDWYTGTKSDEEIMKKYVGGTSLGIRIIGAGLAALLAYAVGGLWGVVIGIIVGALAQLFAWLLELLGISNKAQWIQDVVKAEQGDGFFWSWGFRTTGRSIWLEPGYRMWGSPYTQVWVHEIKEFQRTWGAHRDESPEVYSIDLWYSLYWNAAVEIR